MFSSKCNYPKLKTNFRLTINRLKLMEKKKTELALKSRKEIADYIQMGKEDRARIRVEHIVREDYMVEGMEILEMFCDLLLARFGIIERVSAMDPTIEEAVASIIWAEPRLSADIPELCIISKNLLARYGKDYHAACKANTLNIVNDKLIRKMSIYSPPKALVENYMVEIAKSFNVEFLPDPILQLGEDGGIPLDDLIGIGEIKPGGGPHQPPSGGGGGYPGYPPPGGGSYPGYPPPTGGGGYPGYPPPAGGGGSPGYPPPGYPPPAGGGGNPGYPPPAGGGGSGGYPSAGTGRPPAPGFEGNMGYPPNHSPMSPPPVPSLPPAGPALPSVPPSGGFNIPPENPSGGYPPPSGTAGQPMPPRFDQKPEQPPNYSSLDLKNNLSSGPGPASAPDHDIPSLPEIPSDDAFNLPSVPSSMNPGAGRPPSGTGPSNPNDIDFDDLAARFEQLKKRK